jgi:hypothetical protein
MLAAGMNEALRTFVTVDRLARVWDGKSRQNREIRGFLSVSVVMRVPIGVSEPSQLHVTA